MNSSVLSSTCQCLLTSSHITSYQLIPMIRLLNSANLESLYINIESNPKLHPKDFNDLIAAVTHSKNLKVLELYFTR